MAVQARFYVGSIEQYASAAGYADPAPKGVVKLKPVTRGPANKEWASATPSGEITMTVHGGAFPWFQERLGKEVAITFEDRPDLCPLCGEEIGPFQPVVEVDGVSVHYACKQRQDGVRGY